MLKSVTCKSFFLLIRQTHSLKIRQLTFQVIQCIYAFNWTLKNVLNKYVDSWSQKLFYSLNKFLLWTVQKHSFNYTPSMQFCFLLYHVQVLLGNLLFHKTFWMLLDELVWIQRHLLFEVFQLVLLMTTKEKKMWNIKPIHKKVQIFFNLLRV